ncbi:copper resistance protein NlpE [Weeksellaceae bacterium TAE3-ERU29]|nr:copper resistance protein NlpE [Weeksellaceae bacterium TAE3-ERU29]
MKKNTIIGLLCIFLLIIGCAKENKEFIVTKYGEIEFNSNLDFYDDSDTYFGTYMGSQNCSDCNENISAFLTLNQDYTYSLKVQGRHQCILNNGKYVKEGNIIKLDNKKEFEYQIEGNKLHLINLNKEVNPKVDIVYSLNKID